MFVVWAIKIRCHRCHRVVRPSSWTRGLNRSRPLLSDAWRPVAFGFVSDNHLSPDLVSWVQDAISNSTVVPSSSCNSPLPLRLGVFSLVPLYLFLKRAPVPGRFSSHYTFSLWVFSAASPRLLHTSLKMLRGSASGISDCGVLLHE
jgi:hypothetical protein